MLRQLIIISFLCTFLSSFSQNSDLQTYYELSGGKKTPRYNETIDFCRKLEATSPMVHLRWFGKSPQGRDLPLMILDKQGLTDPLQIRKNGKAVILIQACIHPGESEGKDAGLMLVRDFITGKLPSSILDKISILFIPIFNVDGHERFGPYNRINQNGPEEMGWRVTAGNLNLNRDYVKTDAPEMQAWLKMFSEWLPDFFIDIHTTDGADYQYVMTYYMETSGSIDSGIADFSNNFLNKWTGSLNSLGILNFPYVDFRDWYNPKSGIKGGVTPPMLSQGFTANYNRPGLLLETHMLKPYAVRVEASYKAVVAALEILGKDQKELLAKVRNADLVTSSPEFRKIPFTLHFDTDFKDSTMVEFLGIAYEEVKSPLTGAIWFKYGDTKKTYTLPYFGKVIPSEKVMLPASYIIPAEWQIIIEKMKIHGVQMNYLDHDTVITVKTYMLTNPKWMVNPYEGHHPLTDFSVEEITAEKYFPKGSVIIPMSQPCARLIAHMLEPRGNGSFVAWGFFDLIFEQKEYSERYVMEPIAEKMLKDNPELKKEFDTKMQSDSAFAKNPFLILNWFYSKTPYWDKNLNVYPVGRIY